MVDQAAEDILAGLDAKRSYYRDYDQAMKTAKARAEHERGFWQQARLVRSHVEEGDSHGKTER